MARATRDQIVGEADRLFYEQGFEHTSFADIAAAVGISRGNFYHHFKTKDEILSAVIDRRLEATRALLAAWESEADDSPAARIRCFIRILIANRAKILRHGCPVGTLTAELAKKVGDGASRLVAKQMIALVDKDESGTIDRAELSAAMKKLAAGMKW